LERGESVRRYGVQRKMRSGIVEPRRTHVVMVLTDERGVYLGSSSAICITIYFFGAAAAAAALRIDFDSMFTVLPYAV
jgi:hypothetical protein